MNIFSRIVSVFISLGLLFFISNLVRKKRLKEKYALLWLISGVSMFILALSQNLLSLLSRSLGIELPINTVFFLGIIFLIVVSIHFSVVISDLSEQNKKIAQKISLLEEKDIK